MKKNKFIYLVVVLLFGVLNPVFALSPIQSKYWILNDLRVNFSGINPVTEGQVGNSGTNRISSTTNGVYDAQGNTLFKLLKNTNGEYTLYKYYNSTLLNITSGSTESVGGQLSIIPLRCSAQSSKYLIVYFLKNTAASCQNKLVYRVYDYVNHTLTNPFILENGLCDVGEIAVSQQLHTQLSHNRYLYYSRGKTIRRAEIFTQATSNIGLIPTTSITNIKAYIAYQPKPVELELSHDGTKLAWIDYNDNNVRIIHLNNANQEQVISSSTPQTTMVWTGLEFSPDGKKLLANRFVKTSTFLSSTACFDIASGTSQQALHNVAFSHSHLELSYDGLVYATDGYNLLGMDPYSGNVVKTVNFNLLTNVPHFAFDDDATMNDYNAPSNHQVYRLPNMIDGEVYLPNMGNNGNVPVNHLNGRVCGPSDILEVPDDVVFMHVFLYKNTSNNYLRILDLPGNSRVRLTEVFPELKCSSVDTVKYYLYFFTETKNCGYTTMTYSPLFWVTCTETPSFSFNSLNLCSQSTTQLTLTNPPAPQLGVTINWYVHNPLRTLIPSATNNTQITVPAGRYSVEYAQSYCYISSVPVDVSCPSGEEIDPIRSKNLRTAEVQEMNLVYPNPTTGILSISDYKDVAKISILNLIGHEVKAINANFDKIDLEELNKGMYILIKTNLDGSVTSQRIEIVK